MKLLKKAIRILILLLIAVVLVRQFLPNYLSGPLAFLHPSNTPSQISQVLGAKNSKLIESSARGVVEYFGSLPIIESAYEQATDYLSDEIEKIIQKPQGDVQKVKEDVREKVCEDWLAK